MVPKERLLDIIRNPDFPFMAHFLLLFQRSLILMLRDPWLLTIRFAVHIMCGLCMWAVFKDTGAADGCPPRVPATLDNMDVFQDIKKSYIHDVMRTYANVSAIFFSALFLVFTAMMPTVLTFSSEINILCKEVFNKWYSLTPFYLAKVFAELPLLVILPVMYVTIVYYGTENPHVSWRFFSFTGLMVLNCVVGHAQGSLISIVFVDHPAAGVYVTPVTMVPIMVLSGFFIHVSEMKKMFIVTSYASYVRFVVEAAVVVVYGYDRCGLHVRRQLNQAQNVLLTWIATSMGFDRAWPTGGPDNVTRIAGGFDPIDTANRLADSIVGQMLRDYVGQDGQVRSRLMNEFSVDEDDLWPDIAITVATLVFYRILAYFILYRRVNLMN
ncbi:ATP-binding cassette sub-family G member 4 [Halotydeus destructor]|nr:ATP-binding cassette sub-family G member 4 [Halotydeus destructor]